MKKILLLLIPLLAVGCKPGGGNRNKEADKKPVITVTIEPLRYFTEAIAGDDYRVVSMVPKGSSPETYDPTPLQLTELSQSKAFFRIGYIGFEQTWADRLADNAPHLQFFDLSRGVDLIYDETHAHRHQHGPGSNYREEEEAHSQAQQTDELVGVEPHIWNSAANAQIIAGNILSALRALNKNREEVYLQRYDSLCRRLEQTDSLICSSACARRRACTSSSCSPSSTAATPKS